MTETSTTRPRQLAKVPSQLIEPRLTPWPRDVALLLGATPLGAGVLALMQPGIPMALPLAAGTALTAVAGWRGLRCNRRQRRLADLSNQATLHLEAPLQLLAGRRWHDNTPHELVAAVPPRALLALGAMASTSICAAVGKAVGRPTKMVKKPNRAGRMVLALTNAREPETVDEITQRINDVARQTLGPTANARVTSDEAGQPHRVDITHQAGPKLTVETIQRRILNALTTRMTGDWRTQVDLENDTITLTRRIPLPTKIDRPTGPVAASDVLRIPQAIDEDGQVHYWDFSGVMAHQLFSGRTRTGKTVKLIGDCVEVARRDLPVWVIDPKRIEFLGLRDWPNVQLVATTTPVQIAAIMMVKQLMDERYRQVEEDGVDERSFDRFVLIIDEYRIFYSEVKDWWSRIKVAGMPAQCPVFEWIGALLRMAAAARIHVVLATQRPDAEFLGGEALAVDTKVPTPAGWTTMGDLTPGQYVLAEDGHPVQVSAVTEVAKNRPCYRLTFSDGSTITADANHLWAARSRRQRASDHEAAQRLTRAQRWPNHPKLEQRLENLSPAALGDQCTVSELEAAVGMGRLGLLRAGLNDGRFNVEPVAVRPGMKGRFPARTWRPGQLVSCLLEELSRPAPSWRACEPSLVTTEQMASSVRTDRNEANWSVETAQPLHLPEKELPVDPWLLGYWLGDGHKASASIATADQEVLERIGQLGYQTPHYGRYNYGVVNGGRGRRGLHTLKAALRELGVVNNKHIPITYLRASTEQRHQLLAGLLDADGTCAVRTRSGDVRSGQVSFANTDQRLIEGVAELAASLGFIPTVRLIRLQGVESHPSSVAYGSPTRTTWKVMFTPDRQVFGIGRKQQKLAPSLSSPRRGTVGQRYIVAIEAVPPVPVRCITVDSPRHLYLVGPRFIPTHNCRDNFSARGNTGRLGSDGAEMMYGSPHVGTKTPLNVQGRGTLVDLTDRPREVQYFYTPDPRKANAEERALLDRLRPTTTTWEPLAVTFPDEATLAQLVEDQPKKIAPEWLSIQQAKFVPLAEVGAIKAAGPKASPVDPSDGFGVATYVAARDLQVGDLAGLDDDEDWVEITAIDTSDDGDSVVIEWRHHITQDLGEHELAESESINTRRRQR